MGSRSHCNCFVPMCKSTSVTTPGKRFFSVPSNEKIRLLWFKKCNKRNNIFSVNTHVRICEDHFELERDLENYMEFKLGGMRPTFKKGVVPTKFACQGQELPSTGRPSTIQRNHRLLINQLLTESRDPTDPPRQIAEVYIKEEPIDDATEPTMVNSTSTLQAETAAPFEFVQVESAPYIKQEMEFGDEMGPSYMTEDVKMVPDVTEVGEMGPDITGYNEMGPSYMKEDGKMVPNITKVGEMGPYMTKDVKMVPDLTTDNETSVDVAILQENVIKIEENCIPKVELEEDKTDSDVMSHKQDVAQDLNVVQYKIPLEGSFRKIPLISAQPSQYLIDSASPFATASRTEPPPLVFTAGKSEGHVEVPQLGASMSQVRVLPSSSPSSSSTSPSVAPSASKSPNIASSSSNVHVLSSKSPSIASSSSTSPSVASSSSRVHVLPSTSPSVASSSSTVHVLPSTSPSLASSSSRVHVLPSTSPSVATSSSRVHVLPSTSLNLASNSLQNQISKIPDIKNPNEALIPTNKPLLHVPRILKRSQNSICLVLENPNVVPVFKNEPLLHVPRFLKGSQIAKTLELKKGNKKSIIIIKPKSSCDPKNINQTEILTNLVPENPNNDSIVKNQPNICIPKILKRTLSPFPNTVPDYTQKSLPNSDEPFRKVYLIPKHKITNLNLAGENTTMAAKFKIRNAEGIHVTTEHKKRSYCCQANPTQDIVPKHRATQINGLLFAVNKATMTMARRKIACVNTSLVSGEQMEYVVKTKLKSRCREQLEQSDTAKQREEQLVKHSSVQPTDLDTAKQPEEQPAKQNSAEQLNKQPTERLAGQSTEQLTAEQPIKQPTEQNTVEQAIKQHLQQPAEKLTAEIHSEQRKEQLTAEQPAKHPSEQASTDDPCEEEDAEMLHRQNCTNTTRKLHEKNVCRYLGINCNDQWILERVQRDLACSDSTMHRRDIVELVCRKIRLDEHFLVLGDCYGISESEARTVYHKHAEFIVDALESVGLRIGLLYNKNGFYRV